MLKLTNKMQKKELIEMLEDQISEMLKEQLLNEIAIDEVNKTLKECKEAIKNYPLLKDYQKQLLQQIEVLERKNNAYSQLIHQKQKAVEKLQKE